MHRLFRFLAVLSTAGLGYSMAVTDVSGALVGHDNRPMAGATVMLFERPYSEAAAEATVARDGSFKLSTDKTGILLLRFTGVHHSPETTAFFSDGENPIRVKARLRTAEDWPDAETVTIQARSRRASYNGKPLELQPDGSYLVTFETDEPEIAYRLQATVANSQEGEVRRPTLADGTIAGGYDCESRYQARCYSLAKPVDGRVTIRFDPNKLPYSDRPTTIVFPGDQQRNARLSEIYRNLYQWERLRGRQFGERFDDYEEKALRAWLEGRAVPEFDQSAMEPDNAAVSKLVDEIGNEKDEVVRQMLYLQYLEQMWDTDAADPGLVREALNAIPPDSTVWRWRSNNSWRLSGLLRAAFRIASWQEKHLDYALALADSFGGHLGYWNRARSVDDTAFADAVYARMRELDRDSWSTKWVEVQNEVRGSTVPGFSVPSFDEPGARITNDHFQGKVYLIDFWATWCFPCVAAMPKLHELYKRYSSRGFDILAYSFDSSKETVSKFRTERWPMPWHNSIEPDEGFDSDIAKAFSLQSVPYPVLVDRTGTILEAGEEFSVDDLADKLKQLLGEPEDD